MPPTNADAIFGLGIDVFAMQTNVALMSNMRGLKNELGGITEHNLQVLRSMRSLSFYMATALTGATIGLGTVLGIATAEFAEMERIMYDMRRVTGMSSHEIAIMTKRFIELSAPLPLAAKELASVSVLLAKLGIRGREELEQGALTAAMFAHVTETSAEDTVNAIGRISIAFGKDLATSSNKVASAMLYVEQATSATAEDVATASQRMGGMGRQMGFTIPQVMAISGALRDTGLQARVSATQLVTFMGLMGTRAKDIQKFVGLSTEGYNTLLNTAPFEIFMKVIEKLATLERKDVAIALRSMGINAVRTQISLMGLIPQVDRLRGLLKETNKAYDQGTLLSSQYNLMAQSLSARLKILLNSFKSLGILIGKGFGIPLKIVLNMFMLLNQILLKLPEPIFWIIGAVLGLVTLTTALGAALFFAAAAFLGFKIMIIKALQATMQYKLALAVATGQVGLFTITSKLAAVSLLEFRKALVAIFPFLAKFHIFHKIFKISTLWTTALSASTLFLSSTVLELSRSFGLTNTKIGWYVQYMSRAKRATLGLIGGLIVLYLMFKVITRIWSALSDVTDKYGRAIAIILWPLTLVLLAVKGLIWGLDMLWSVFKKTVDFLDKYVVPVLLIIGTFLWKVLMPILGRLAYFLLKKVFSKALLAILGVIAATLFEIAAPFIVIIGLVWLFWDALVAIWNCFKDILGTIFGSSFLHLIEGVTPVLSIFSIFIAQLLVVKSLFESIARLIGWTGISPTITTANVTTAERGGGLDVGGGGSTVMASRGEGGRIGNIIVPITVELDGRVIYKAIKEISGEEAIRGRDWVVPSISGIGAWG